MEVIPKKMAGIMRAVRSKENTILCIVIIQSFEHIDKKQFIKLANLVEIHSCTLEHKSIKLRSTVESRHGDNRRTVESRRQTFSRPLEVWTRSTLFIVRLVATQRRHSTDWLSCWWRQQPTWLDSTTTVTSQWCVGRCKMTAISLIAKKIRRRGGLY